MDRAEAIKAIQIHKAYMPLHTMAKTKEALDMAIAALREQEELEKLCSERGALLDEIHGMCNLCTHYCGGDGDEHCRECAFDSRFEWRGMKG